VKGFFDPRRYVEKNVPGLVAKCGLCRLYENCFSPFMKVDGRGEKRILLVGEAPAEEEDAKGQPFVGPAGRYLQSALELIGVDMRVDCWITNSVICKPEGLNPTEKQVDYCRPNLLRTLRELQPDVVILLGKVPLNSLMWVVYKEKQMPISAWAGFRIPSQKPNCWICPTWHPSALMRAERSKEPNYRAYRLWWLRHLKTAFALAGKGPPWKVVPDYRERVEILFDPRQAVPRIAAYENSVEPVAFDFETTTLKPDGPHAEIVCCSMSDGKTAIAFPMLPETTVALKHFLRCSVPKVGSNVKFEDRWAARKLSVRVNWTPDVWDTMLAAHWDDNRPGVTSIKFQAYALLGAPEYDKAVAPFLKGQGGGNAPNRIRECDPRELLLYCGLDSLLEAKVARIQRRRVGLCSS
jgi:DNA polymerase